MSAREGRHEQHSTYSASSADRWSRPDGCPGSAILVKLRGPTESSDAAAEGTQAHELLETVLKWKEENGTLEDLSAVSNAYPEKARKGVETALEYLDSLMVEGVLYEKFSEEKWSLSICEWLPPEDEVYGYADIVIFDPTCDKLHVFDYKHGVHPVSANSRQLKQYAAAVIEWFGASSIKAVELHIIQPYGYDNEPTKSYPASLDEIAQYVSEARAAIEANAVYHFTGEIDQLTYRPSAKNCHWCAGFPLCKAAKEAGVGPVEAAAAYGPDELGAALERAEFLEVWAKELRSFALDRLKSGAEIPGWGLEPVSSHRKFITSGAQVAEKLSAYLSYDECMPRELISPAAAEKLLRAKLKGTKRKQEEALLKLAELVDKPVSGNMKLAKGAKAVDLRKHIFGEIRALETEKR